MKRGLGLAVVVALVVATAATAKPRLIASSVDSGVLPIATADVSVGKPGRGPLVEVKASPERAVELDLSIRCYRGAHNRGKDFDPVVRSAPLRRRFPLPMRNSDSCSVSAFANYDEEEDANGNFAEGRISLKIFR